MAQETKKNSADPLAPFDAVLVASYGGPYLPEDVLPFMRNATAGRGVPDTRLMEVSTHYAAHDGSSPINARNSELVAALANELKIRGTSVPVIIGNRNWHPFFDEALTELYDHGYRNILLVPTAAYPCYSGCRQYREDVACALATLRENGRTGMEVSTIGSFYDQEGFIAANADALDRALEKIYAELGEKHTAETGKDSLKVLFVTHSIPLAMARNSGGKPGIDDYVSTNTWVCEQVARKLAEKGANIDWELVYCSRSGAPHIPWLEPDVNDRLNELADQGVKAVITAPTGFINDHMEVVFDLDTEAAGTADELGIHYVRADTAGVDPRFIKALTEVIFSRAQKEREEPGINHGLCGPNCCQCGHPGAGKVPAIAEDGWDQPILEGQHTPASFLPRNRGGALSLAAAAAVHRNSETLNNTAQKA